MLSVAIVFILKFLDCSLGTLKTLLLIKDKFFYSSVLNSISSVLFLCVADLLSNAQEESKYIIILVIFIANLTGSYIPAKLLDNFEQDRLFVYHITAPNLEIGKVFADDLRAHNIPISTNKEYDSQRIKTLAIRAYASTKEQSRIITRHLNDDFKWHLVEAI